MAAGALRVPAGTRRPLLSLAAVIAALATGFCATVFVGGPWAAAWPRGTRSAALSVGSGAARAVPAPASIATEVRGAPGSRGYRLFFADSSGSPISPWHDIALHTDVPAEKLMVTEIPKMTKAKMEIATSEANNPIAQDTKNGQLREYHGPIFWNYGFFPQTWEDPSVEHPDMHVLGDNDPLDVVEIGSRTHRQGEISRVRVLGALAMVDSGELDWKIVAIDTQDPLASQLHDIVDVQSQMPGVVSGIREWFRWYKTPDGKPLNAFGFDGRVLNAAAALAVIDETHEAWRRLRSEKHVHGLWVGR